MNTIIPTIFSKNKKEFKARFDKLIKISKNLQVDFMDSKFVPGKSIQVKEIPKLPPGSFEAHLMVKNPERYLDKLKQKGFNKIIFHYGTTDNVKIIAEIKKLKMKAFLAVNPEDKISDFCYLLDLVDGILVMGVHPGKEHQKILPGTINKIKQLRKLTDLPIQVDGGVSPGTIKSLKKAGATIFNSGSFVSEAKNPKEALMRLRKS